MQDVISGFFILLEDQIRVGDVVQIADKDGLVERITLRMVVLRDLAGNIHYVRNGQIQVVTNMTKEYGRYVFDIGVAYREDVDNVIEVIKEVDEELRSNSNFKEDILEPIEILGLDRFADSAVIIFRLFCYGKNSEKIVFGERAPFLPVPASIHVVPGLLCIQDGLWNQCPICRGSHRCSQ